MPAGLMKPHIQNFAHNRLVVIYPEENPAGLDGLEDLARPGLKLVMAAKEVPVGQYSLDFLEKASQEPTLGPSFQQAVLKNIVSYEENVRAVLNKVALGEADAGIVYSSDVSGEAAGKIGQLMIPDELNVIASYPIAVLKDSQHASQAQAFVRFRALPHRAGNPGEVRLHACSKIILRYNTKRSTTKAQQSEKWVRAARTHFSVYPSTAWNKK